MYLNKLIVRLKSNYVQVFIYMNYTILIEINKSKYSFMLINVSGCHANSIVVLLKKTIFGFRHLKEKVKLFTCYKQPLDQDQYNVVIDCDRSV